MILLSEKNVNPWKDKWKEAKHDLTRAKLLLKIVVRHQTRVDRSRITIQVGETYQGLKKYSTLMSGTNSIYSNQTLRQLKMSKYIFTSILSSLIQRCLVKSTAVCLKIGRVRRQDLSGIVLRAHCTRILIVYTNFLPLDPSNHDVSVNPRSQLSIAST